MVKRRIDIQTVSGIRLSPFQDDIVIIDVQINSSNNSNNNNNKNKNNKNEVVNDFTLVIEPNFKTEFLTLLSKAQKAKTGWQYFITQSINQLIN